MASQVSELFVGDHLMGNGIQIDLNQGHLSITKDAPSWQHGDANWEPCNG